MNKLVAAPDSELDARITRLEQIVSHLTDRLACTCGASAQSTWLGYGANSENQLKPTHQPFCPLYVKPSTRYRDCWNCGNVGVTEESPGEFSICSTCHGTGQVSEFWSNGTLVNSPPSAS